jgi:hypothetical protein
MIALQYKFVLPADYDMHRIRDRIASRGSTFDGCDGLIFKAFALSDRAQNAPANLYAPFYLWLDAPSVLAFLSGPLFEAVSNAFGRPEVATGLVTSTHGIHSADSMKSALRRRRCIAGLGELAQRPESQHLVGAMRWLDPTKWIETAIEFNPIPATRSSAKLFSKSPTLQKVRLGSVRRA